MTTAQAIAACRAAHSHLADCVKNQNLRRIEAFEDAVCGRVAELLDLGMSFDAARVIALAEDLQ